MTRRLRIGLNIFSNDSFWIETNEAIYQRAQQVDVELIPVYANYFHNSPSQPARALDQTVLVDEALNQNLDAMIGWDFPEHLAYRVLNAGVPIISPSSEIPIQHPLFVSREGLYAAAQMLGNHIVERLGGKGYVVVIGGLTQNLSSGDGRNRVEGFHDVFERYPQLRWTHIRASWNYDTAYVQGCAALEADSEPIDAILGLSDSLAMAGREAARTLNRLGSQTLIGGINGDTLALASIAEGNFTATVETSATDLGQQMFDLAYQAAQGLPLPKRFNFKRLRLVTSQNVMEVAAQKLMDIANLPNRMVMIERYEEQQRRDQEALKKSNTELELVNRQLAESQRQTEQLSNAKSVFLSNMSHELRTPLNVIIGYSSSMLKMPQMFENVPIADVHRPYLKLIEENGYYLVGLINDILDLSKIEAGKLELHRSSISLRDLFQGVLATSIGLVKDKPVQLRSDFPDDLPPVWADPLRVRQIILNLMSNAIKFTATGSVTLAACTEGDMIRISVKDTGTGISEKALATIFDRFQQAEHNTDLRYGGTGLGLDISKQLCLMHGGEITVQSVVGQGSTFAFTLPISQEVLPESGQGPGDLEGGIEVFAKTAKQPVTSQIILVIEDEVSMRDMLHRALEGAGHVVVDTQDGNQALELALGLLPNLIILDVYLPGQSGWDVLKRLKEMPETAAIPVIICTVDDDSRRAKDLGASAYLRKPVTSVEVLDCVQQIIVRRPKSESEPQ